MEDPDKPHTTGKVDIILKGAHQYNYFQLLELLYQLHGDDLELRLNPKEAPPFSLRPEHGTHLGWTSFIADRNDLTPPPVRITVLT